MVKSLLAPYENRAWAQTNWILARLWKVSTAPLELSSWFPGNCIFSLGTLVLQKSVCSHTSSHFCLENCGPEKFNLENYLTLR